MMEINASSPGRICLFGEHQDYLQLPVIPCAISLRVSIKATGQSRPVADLDLPDIGSSESIDLTVPSSYVKSRDYLRSSVNVMLRQGYEFSQGIRARVQGDIPINSGTSSSSALIAAWIALLAFISRQHKQLSPEEIARLAHQSEVVEFNEPGGMMDHYATAFGGVIYIRFYPQIEVEQLRPQLGNFVLGDSGQPKDTKRILARVKEGVLRLMKGLSRKDARFSLQTTQLEELYRFASMLSLEEKALLKATLYNRDLTMQGVRLLTQTDVDHRRLGELLCEQQRLLRDGLQISTPKIDQMLDAAMNAGALGGKINGSGGGGCMFAYAPERAEQVAEAIANVGGKAYIVTVGEGTTVTITS